MYLELAMDKKKRSLALEKDKFSHILPLICFEYEPKFYVIQKELVCMDKTYLIAEMACSHEGDPVLAKKIIDGAGQAGADAVQFQIWKLTDMMVPDHPDYELLQALALSYDQWTELSVYTRQNYPGMDIIACVYEKGSVDFAQLIEVDAFKLHSADLSNPGLVKYVARTGKRIDLSVGASTLDEIFWAVQWIKEISDVETWLMYGYQSFPTPTDSIHLDYMMTLKKLFNLPVGYQDHTDAESEAAFWLPAAAVGMGVDILEKHITYDRSIKGADHQAALNPDEFKRFAAMLREIETAKGNATIRSFTPEELQYRRYSKKSIIAARPLPKGSVIKKEDLLFMRASKLGVPPDRANIFIGKKIAQNVAAYQLLKENMVYG
jgi:sialic acid synthase SpsE